MSTRVLVTGASGQVGRDLVDALRGQLPPGGDSNFTPDGTAVSPAEFDVVAVTRTECDVTDSSAVDRTVAQCQPEVVVNLAAYTAVDRAESDEEECFAINATAVGSLAERSRRGDFHLVTLSTDFVFAGDKGSAYVEDDPSGPLNVYGASKLAGEHLCSDGTTIVRTSWVMGARGRNVARTVRDRLVAGGDVSFVSDQRGSPTMAADLARSLITMVRHRPGGVWHLANEGEATWYEVAKEVAILVGRPDHAHSILSSELHPAPAARRPARSDLSTLKWQSAGWEALPHWRDSLARLVPQLT
jgi:dTDP-4-dehydrorhamnose reductase